MLIEDELTEMQAIGERQQIENADIVYQHTIGNSKIVYMVTKSASLIEGEEIKVYGVKVSCSLFGKKETAWIKDVTSDFSLAVELLDILADNAVLPTSLKDIVEDFINSKYSID